MYSTFETITIISIIFVCSSTRGSSISGFRPSGLSFGVRSGPIKRSLCILYGAPHKKAESLILGWNEWAKKFCICGNRCTRKIRWVFLKIKHTKKGFLFLTGEAAEVFFLAHLTKESPSIFLGKEGVQRRWGMRYEVDKLLPLQCYPAKT